jgi:hypothetical protein
MKSVLTLPPAPRRVTVLRPIAFSRFALWLFLLGAVVGLPIQMNRSLGRLRYLEAHGELVRATVVSAQDSSGRGSANSMVVSFSMDGADVIEQETVSRKVYQTYAGSPTVPVTVRPGNPRDFEIGTVTGDTIDDAEDLWLLGTGLAVLIGGACVLWIELSLRIEVRLVSQGEETTGRVDSSVFVRGRYSSTTVRYAYMTSLGDRTGSTSLSGNQTGAYPPGAALQVLFDPSKPKQSVPVSRLTMVRLREDRA